MGWFLKIAVIISTILLAFAYSDGQLPSQGKYKTLQEKGKDLQESEIENPRTPNPTRKASENKKPWLSDGLLDMEDMVFEPHDVNWWDYEWPDPEDNPPNPLGPRDWNFPGAIPFNYMKGCVLNCPSTVTNCGETIRCTFGILAGVLVDVSVSGPIRSYKVNANNPGEGVLPTIDIIPSPNATDGGEIKVVASSKALKKGKEADGVCSASIKMLCECFCLGTIPTIFASAQTIDRGSTVNLWVESGGLACPNFSWSVSGTGFTLSRSQTDGDYVINRLQADATACGSATITVTDKCGVSATGYIRCNNGSEWIPKGNTCGLPGAYDSYVWTGTYDFTKISGNKKQLQSCSYSGYFDPTPCAPDCNGAVFESTGWCNNWGFEAEGYCISFAGIWCACQEGIIGGNKMCDAIRTLSLSYSEWECSP